MVLWIQLHKLPIEYYAFDALYAIGKTLGKPIKVDLHTMESNRGRYARICLEMETDKALPTAIQIGSRIQPITYEIKVEFCFQCGKIGFVTIVRVNMMHV